MCTITTQKKAIKTTEDIHSFKKALVIHSFKKALVIRTKTVHLIQSPFMGYRHKINELDTARISFSKEPEREFTCFDEREVNVFYHGSSDRLNGVWGREPLKEYVGKLRAAEKGFHSCINIDRLDSISKYDTVKCIIPKGSLVYYGSEGLIVSNKIIVTDEII